MDLQLLEQALASLGCPAEKCPEMAAQLDKRARQLSEQRGQPYEEALLYLLKLMRDGMNGNTGSQIPPPAGNQS
jgi:hypothetical protein